MKLLAIDTSTNACSVALLVDGETRQRFEITPKAHTTLLLPMVESLLTEAELKLTQLDALAFGCGPGSFTGLRIAAGVVQGLAFGADLPVVPVSTLAALAQQYSNKPLSFVAMDARIGEVFWGVYEKNADGFVELIGQEVVAHIHDLTFPPRHAVGIGSGWAIYAQALSQHTQGWVTDIHHDVLPQASAIATLGALGFHQGKSVCAQDAQPVYLRDKVAQTEIERKNAKLNVENTP